MILDSVQVKTRTFAAMFNKYGSDVEHAVVDYHLTHGGVSRFKKFEHYYKNLLNEPITPEKLQLLGEEFSRLALQGVLDSPYIPGAMNTLKLLKEQEIPCFVVSGTPDTEIKLIVKTKQLDRYFLEVHGSPRKKDEILVDIIDRYDLTPGECLFIGDAMTDYEASRACGTDFLGILSDNNHSPFPPHTKVNNQVSIDV